MWVGKTPENLHIRQAVFAAEKQRICAPTELSGLLGPVRPLRRTLNEFLRSYALQVNAHLWVESFDGFRLIRIQPDLRRSAYQLLSDQAQCTLRPDA